jgi:hypothetical protein
LCTGDEDVVGCVKADVVVHKMALLVAVLFLQGNSLV